MTESFQLSPDEARKLKLFMSGVRKPDAPIYPVRSGGLLSMNQVAQQIRQGSDVGREAMEIIMKMTLT